MRDAFGGAFMIKLLLVFIIIYVGFTAIALNYAKAFKVKNKVIEYLEDNEITDICHMSASNFDEMENFIEREILTALNYQASFNVSSQCNTIESHETGERIEYSNHGILIVKKVPTNSQRNKLGEYYTVSTAFGWSIPFLNSLLQLSGSDGEVASGFWIISGETRSIIKE